MCIDSRQSIQLCPYHMGTEHEETFENNSDIDVTVAQKKTSQSFVQDTQ